MKPVIALATGDPFGIGPEICLKAAVRPDVLGVCRPILVGDRAHLIAEARLIQSAGASYAASHAAPPAHPAIGAYGAQAVNLPDPAVWPEVSISGFAEMGSKQGADFLLEKWHDGPAILDMGAIDEAPRPRGPSAAGGRAAIKYIKQAVGLARVGSAAAIVTAPISKRAVHLAGHNWPGHTELLADLCGAEMEYVAMLFVAPDLKVALLSTHAPLKEAIANLDRERIVRRLALLHEEHRRWFGSDPRIGVCALNPHAGEEGLFGREEEEILAPACEAARSAGIDARGPFPADTLFTRATRGEFDLVLALFHDQGTIAVKTHAFGRAVNMTLGLPLLRTSVDHGTAFDIAGTGVADPTSLAEAILLAARLAPRAGL
ncbi:MAG TPA: 4-hydroxythreonine-4-phosphate dehydrogenase PdxA [Candidatus Polarisedimenticolia bacterium]|nr:4-hydroxythreonine-4-phosphate dehydrogenase PdxA [Candidatus Polarisedimenticolia bacterium]